MTDNIAEAFEHPEARARASGGLPDRLSLRDFIATADIGAFQEERGEGSSVARGQVGGCPG